MVITVIAYTQHLHNLSCQTHQIYPFVVFVVMQIKALLNTGQWYMCHRVVKSEGLVYALKVKITRLFLTPMICLGPFHHPF